MHEPVLSARHTLGANLRPGARLSPQTIPRGARLGSGKAVNKWVETVQKLCTKFIRILAGAALSPEPKSYTQRYAQVVRRLVHIILVDFTEVAARLSPLSTALIKHDEMDIKIYIKESCGRTV